MYAENLLQGKIGLVTGGRSGIGFAIAKKYLQLGAKVIIASRDQNLLTVATKELGKYGECAHCPCDIRAVDDIEKLATFIDQKFGRLDILVNNAGGQFPATAELMSHKGWAAVINNNLNGTFYMSQIMAKKFFIPQKDGNIVNIIANVSRGFPGMSHTGAARAAVENLTKSLAQEWAEYHIRVNAIAPGIIESSGLENYPPQITQHLEQARQQNLFQRFGTVEEVANSVVFLSCSLSSYTSGITLAVDGLDHLVNNSMDLYRLLRSFY